MIEEGAFNADTYTEMRAEKDAYFESDDSPLPSNERDHFKGLRYWKPSADFVVNATMEAQRGRFNDRDPNHKRRHAPGYTIWRVALSR